jgi:DNA-binding SARP family transcriptional activator/transcriptional regulator with XRE-family HTH domain
MGDHQHLGSLSARLRAYREAAGLTQHSLASQAGIAVATLRDIEQGRTVTPRPASVTRLAEALQLSGRQRSELAALAAAPAISRPPGPPKADDNGKPRVRVEVLGPVGASRNGAPVPLGPVRQRAVLALLALHADTGLSRAAIIDALWHDDPPAAAVVMVQGYITQIRGLLGSVGGRSAAGAAGVGRSRAGGSALRWDGACYRLEAGTVQSDWGEFAGLADRARQAAAADPADPAAACDLYEQALRLWRSDPLADIEFLRDHPAVTELSSARAAVVIDYAAAASAAGMHEAVMGHLRALTAREPLNERAQARLMIALAATGQQAAALGVYEDLRRRLDDELGVRPGGELADAQTLVLRQQISPAGAAPAHDGLVPRQPTLPHQLPVPRHLPAAVQYFVGRTGELKALTGLLGRAGGGSPGTVVISAIGGTAGVGKTALAVHWAHRVADRFPDGQLYVDLRGFDPAGTPVASADAIRRFLEALQVPADQIPSSAEAQQDMYRSLLADRRMLIVLDNARDTGQVRPLLPAGPRHLVLVTSRNQLTSLVAAEGAHPVALDVLNPADARDLLARRLGQARIEAEADAVTELTELCARLPLALAIAGAHAALHPGLPLATLVTKLRNASSRLDALDAGQDASVRAVFSWSYQHLPAPAARMFRLLGVHSGPDITAAAAASLTGAAPDQARATLNQLTRSNLLTESTLGRFGFHDLLRAYAAERARTEDSPADLRDAIHRALDHYLHTAFAAGQHLDWIDPPTCPPPAAPGTTPEQVADRRAAFAWFEAERLVLSAVVSQAAQRGFDSYAVHLPQTLREFYIRRGHWHDSAASLRIALGAAERTEDPAAQAAAHRYLGAAFSRLHRYQDAREQLALALDQYGRLGDQLGQARAYYQLALISYRQGDDRTAVVHGRRSRRLARGWPADEAHALNGTGWFHARLGNLRLAEAYCDRALIMHRQVGSEIGEALTLQILGCLRLRTGDHPQAIALLGQAVTACRGAGYLYHHADMLDDLGDAYHAAGDLSAARDSWLQALDIFENLRHARTRQVSLKLRPPSSVETACLAVPSAAPPPPGCT